MKSETQIKAELEALLAARKLDYGKILSLSTNLAAHDPDHLRFSVDAGLISRLGQELVARQETAVSELVKNAYDADAQEARLIFSGAEKIGGRLFIKDDGIGMDRDQLIQGFMRLASSEKIHNPKSPLYGRQRAGRKGIGRFATQRLGKSLTLVTQTIQSKHALRLKINWTDFEDDAEISKTANRIENAPKEREQGTTLIIDGLREAWSDVQIARVYRYVEDLLQPFTLSERKLTTTRDPGFKAIFCRLKGIKEIIIASEDKMVFDHALAVVSGEVNSSGKGQWNVVSERLGLDEHNHPISPVEHSPSVSFPHLRNVKFTAHYFIWSTKFVPGHQLSRLQNLSSLRGGIRLYRNGFRVLPYGEAYNDWLSLDAAYRKREVLPPIGNNNWFGFVELHDAEGVHFNETSSREGLAANVYYDELVEFVSGSLKAAALRIAASRGKKQTAGQRGYVKKKHLSIADKLEQAAEDLEDVANTLTAKGSATSSQTVRGVIEYIKGTAEESEDLIQELAMLRVLASLGLTIGEFTHEVRTRLTALRCDFQDMLAKRGRANDIEGGLMGVDAHFKMLQSYVAYFDSTISASVQRELYPQELSTIVYRFVREFAPVVRRSGITFEDPAIEAGLFTRPIHESELASVLANFLTNSIKAIKRTNRRTGGKICIRAWREGDMLLLDFLDNGDGIPKENEERIFEPFFTTTRNAKSIRTEIDELTGTGLGLKIVRDIVSTAGGDVYVATATKPYFTCIRIELPAGKDPN